MFNFNKVITINEFYPILISVSFLPMLAFYIIRFFSEEAIKIRPLFYIALLSLVMASGFYESTFTLIIAIGILSFLIYSIFFFKYSMKKKAFKFSLVAIVIVLSSFWIVPSLWVNTFEGFALAPSTISGASVLVNEINYNHGLTLETLLTFDYPLAGFSLLNQFLGKYLDYFLLSSIGLFLTTQLFILLPRKDKTKNKIKFFDSLVITLFVLAIIDWPYQIFYIHFIFGILFTLTISWEYFILPLWFSIIMGLSISAFPASNILKDKCNKSHRNKIFHKLMRKTSVIIRWAPSIIICILILAYTVPIAEYSGMGVNQNVGLVRSNYVPSKSFINTGNFLSNKTGEGNILELPIIAGDYLLNSTHSNWEVGTPLSYFTCSFTEYRDRAGVNDTLTYPILNNFQQNPKGNLSNYLALFGIKYIILIKNMDTGNYLVNYNLSTFLKLENYFNESRGFRYLKSYGNYTIFSINQTNPLIYASNAYSSNYLDPNNSTIKLYDTFISNRLNYNNNSLFYGLKHNITQVNDKDIRINWKKTGLNEYKVIIKANKTFALNFLMGYSLSWESYHWILKINGKNMKENQYVANLFANGWALPKGNYTADICLSYANEQNITYIVSFVPGVGLILIPAITFIRLRVINISRNKR